MEFAEYISTPMIDNVKLTRNGKTVEGTLCVTGHHLILSSRANQHEELWVRPQVTFNQLLAIS